MKIGTVLYYEGKGLLSNGIKLCSCSKFSHTSIVTHILREELMDSRPVRKWSVREASAFWIAGLYIVESTTLNETPCEVCKVQLQGVQVQKLERLLSYPGHIWKQEPKRPYNTDEICLLTEYLLDKVGTEYDLKGVGMAGLRLLSRFLPCTYSRKKFFCSELVASAILYALEGRVLPEIEPGRLSPGALAACLSASGLYRKPTRMTRKELQCLSSL